MFRYADKHDLYSIYSPLQKYYDLLMINYFVSDIH